jgi:hypothetical protein
MLEVNHTPSFNADT